MKKLIYTYLLVAFVAITTAQAQEASAAKAEISWEKSVVDFGDIEQGKPVTAEFHFENTGDVPLIISNARGSCGCTGVTWPKEPIPPGGKGMIPATYNAAAMGAFNKSVTVTANTPEGVSRLMIKGVVKPANKDQ